MTILKEEVDITPYVERGLVGVNVDAVRDNINTFLNGVLGKCFITPYIALERVRKVLANFHIFLPRTTFLEGDRGVEVFDIKQFGEAMGMRNDGTVVTKMSDPYSLYFEYKMNGKGMFDVFAEIVTKDELDELMDAVNDDMDDDAEDDREDKLNESETKRLSPEEMEKIKAEYQKKKRESKQVEGPKSKYPSMKDIFEDSESVKMAGAETGPRRIAGQPDYGMAPDYEDTCEAKPKMKLVMKKKINEGVIETIKRKIDKASGHTGINEGIISNIKNRLSGRRGAVLKKIGKDRSNNLDDVSRANRAKATDISIKASRAKDPVERASLRNKAKETKALGDRQQLHSISMYLDPEASLRRTSNYMTGKGKPKSEPKIDDDSDLQDRPDVAAIKKKRLTRFSQRRLSPPRVDEAAMDNELLTGKGKRKDLAEGEVLKFPSKTVKNEPGTLKKDPKALLRTRERNEKLAANPPDDWVQQALKQGKKPGLLQRLFPKKKV
jgi:hypothetical protein